MGELIFVGLGLEITRHLTKEAEAAIRDADRVFAEFYTSRLAGGPEAKLDKVLGRPVEVLARADVEGGQKLLDAAKTQRVVLLTGGDPMTATTHQDLRHRALAIGLTVRIVHGISIQTAAAGAAGLQSYKFGRTTTLVFPEPNHDPSSPYEAIWENRSRGLHTLVLLDLRAEENRFMSASEGVRRLLKFEKELKGGAVPPDLKMVALARIGGSDEKIVFAPGKELAQTDLGPPLHCLIVPGKLHFSEEEMLRRFSKA